MEPHALSRHWTNPVAPHCAVAWDRLRHSQGAVQVTVGTGVGVAVVLATMMFGVTGRPETGLTAAVAMVLQSTSVTMSILPSSTRE
jgi:Kef-type K+ transport system membrane component KefB